MLTLWSVWVLTPQCSDVALLVKSRGVTLVSWPNSPHWPLSIMASFILSIVNETPALNAEGTSDVFKRLKIFNRGETNNIHSGEK